jgi:hypothetical protein
MDTQWNNVFVNTPGNVPNGNLYELINGDTIPTIPTSMTGGQRKRRQRRGNVTKRPHQQDWSSLSPLSHLSSPLPPNVTDNRKMRKGKKTGGKGGFWGP